MTNCHLQLTQTSYPDEPILYFTEKSFKEAVERIVDERLKILIEGKDLRDER